MKTKYYKPRTLIIGILLFGLSILIVGILFTINTKDGVQNINDTLYVWGLVLSIIGMIVGEGLILDAASYKVENKEVQEE